MNVVDRIYKIHWIISAILVGLIIKVTKSNTSVFSIQNRLNSMFFEEDNTLKSIEIGFESKSIPNEFYNKGRKIDIFTSNTNTNLTNSFKNEKMEVTYLSSDKKIFLPKIIKNLGLINTFDTSINFDLDRKNGMGINPALSKKQEKNNYFEKELQRYYSTEIQGKNQYYFPHVNNNYKLECSIPFKKSKSSINQNSNFHSNLFNFTSNDLIEKNAFLLMKNIAYLCSSSDIREWFFKVCPFSSAHQQLKNLKILPNGTSYVEFFNLGTKEGYFEHIREMETQKSQETLKDSFTTIENYESNNEKKSTSKNLFDIDKQEIKQYENIDQMQNMQIKNIDNIYSEDFDLNDNFLNLDNSKSSNDKVLFAKKAYIDANLNNYFLEEINKIAELNSIILADDSLEKTSFLFCDGRVCKILNDLNFNKYKDYECEILLEYKGAELKYFLDKNEEVFYHEKDDQEVEAKRTIQLNNLDEYIYNYLFSVNEINDKKYMDSIEKYSNTNIRLSRKIMRFVTENTFAINKSFPNKNKYIYTKDFKYECKDKKPNINSHNYLSVNKELAYCSKCDFIHQVQNGDFLVLVSFKK